MSRHHLLTAAAVLLSALAWSNQSAVAAQLTLSAPATFSPGMPFDVKVHLEGASNLNAFSVEMQITAPIGAYGADYSYLLPVADPATDPAYILGTNALGFLAIESPAGSGTLMFSDLLVDANAGVNSSSGHDLLARITVLPTAGFQGPLTVSILPDNLNLLNANLNSIAGFGELSDTLPSISVALVPEPASAALLLIGGLSLLGRRSWKSARRI